MYQSIFKAGTYEPQGTFTAKDVFDIANGYDPVNIHEACMWVGHPNLFGGEPKALAWIKSLQAAGEDLQAEFTDVSPELKRMIDSKEFKRCSVELGKVKKEDGAGGFTEQWYLFAVGLTNRPAVGSLSPLTFSNTADRKFFPDKFTGERVSFALNDITFFSPNNPNQNQTIIMFAKLIQTAAKFGLNVTGVSETNADALFAQMESKYAALSSENSDLKTENTSLKTETANFSKQRAEDLLASAVSLGKIPPADKAKYVSFAQANYADAKVMFEAMPVNPVLRKDLTGIAAASGSDTPDAKFTDENGKPLTYDKFLEFAKKNPKYVDKFTEAEINKLKKESEED
jgi:Mu-like prophage I protein